MSETSEVVGPTKKALERRGYYVDRLNAGSPNPRIRGVKKGTADLIVLLPPTGRAAYLEAKRPGAKPRNDQSHQAEWANMVRSKGARYSVFTSVGEGVALIRTWTEAEERRGAAMGYWRRRGQPHNSGEDNNG